jgi:hypothetical protein
MRMRARTAVLLLVLLVTVGLVVFAPDKDERASHASSASGSDARSAGNPAARPGQGEASNSFALPSRAQLGKLRAELFSSQSWISFKPLAAVVASAPVAPPMPYMFAGKLVNEGQLSVFLSKGDVVFPVVKGETIDGAYRVESIEENQITLTYLPLGKKESIPIVSSLEGVAPAAPPSQRPVVGAAPVSSVLPVSPQASVQPANAPAAGAANADSRPAQLHWDGPRQVRLGASFDVALRVNSEQPLNASPMQLRFDPAVLEAVTVKPGKFFGTGERNFSYRINPDGSIYVGASNRDPSSASDAELLVITFKSVKSAPQAELSIASLNLQGPAGRAIAVTQLAAFKAAITP